MSVRLLTRPNTAFSGLYLAVREKEGRVFSDVQAVALPDLPHGHPHRNEWKLRQKSARRFLHYLSARPKTEILDIGCGNGWFSNLMAQAGHRVTATDVNLPELEQAARVFKSENLEFVCADPFRAEFGQTFDLIVFNSCFQYFPEPEKILEAAKKWLADNGEIHILDSPFYLSSELESARERTSAYYAALGFPEMAAHYFHHSLHVLGNFRIRYKPRKWLRSLRRDSPFYWVSISE
jgi:2-polyprenyl-3-methyl-5-hydroxy-6-metoxy-1,4-benzoquinol methylase